MGNGPPPEGPAMRRSMETRCCAALDRDPAVTFLGIAAETIATKQSSDCREDCLPLLRHALSGDRVNPDRPVNFLQHLEAAGGGGRIRACQGQPGKQSGNCCSTATAIGVVPCTSRRDVQVTTQLSTDRSQRCNYRINRR